MTTKSKTNLKIVQPDLEQMEAVVTEAASQTGPMVQRLSVHRDRFSLSIKELQSERDTLVARRDLLRRQAAAVDEGLSMHIEDIDKTLRLYTHGSNGIEQPRD